MVTWAPSRPETASSGLVRGVYRWDAVALMVNGIVGAGIFALPSKVHALVGGYGLLAFAACALIVAGIALCCAEVASRFTETGGAYLYARRAFGPHAAFGVGWLMWLTRLSAAAAIVNVTTSYLGYFWAPAASGIGRASFITIIVATLTAVNVVGVRRAATLCNLFTIGKLVPLLLFTGVGLFFLDPRAFTSAARPGLEPFTAAIAQLIFAFGRYEATVVAGGEISDPRHDLPFATLLTIGFVAILYLLIQSVCIGTLPDLAASQRPLADASARFMGSAGGSIIAAGAVLSTVGVLLGGLLIAPRVLFAMAVENQVPPVLGRIHGRFHTPHVAILVGAGLVLGLALSGSFTYLATLNVLARLTTFLATIGSLLVFRRRGDEPAATFRVPFGAVVPLVSLAACLWLLARAGGRELRDVAIAVAVGFSVYGAHRLSRGRAPRAPA